VKSALEKAIFRAAAARVQELTRKSFLGSAWTAVDRGVSHAGIAIKRVKNLSKKLLNLHNKMSIIASNDGTNILQKIEQTL
jgi:hypothetical protein